MDKPGARSFEAGTLPLTLFSKSSDGETWSTAVNIWANAGASWSPAIAVGSDIHVVWQDNTGGDYDILCSKCSGASLTVMKLILLVELEPQSLPTVKITVYVPGLV